MDKNYCIWCYYESPRPKYVIVFKFRLIQEFFSDVPPKFTVAWIEKPEEHITVSCIDGDIEDLTATGEPDDPFCKNSLDTSKLVRKYFFSFSYKSKISNK